MIKVQDNDIENVYPSEPLTIEDIQEISSFIIKEKIRLKQEGHLPEKVKK